jgi:hypothetical protein
VAAFHFKTLPINSNLDDLIFDLEEAMVTTSGGGLPNHAYASSDMSFSQP